MSDSGVRVARARWRRLLLAAAPVGVGLGVAVLLGAVVGSSETADVEVGARQPLAAAEILSDCSSCHPRQSAEWNRSVMAHSVKSPLFQALEMLIQEQVGRDLDCPGGAGVLREADPGTACRNRATGLPITGSGGELWCANCHSPGENLRPSLPAWDGRSPRSASRLPLRDLLPESTMEGISCAFCHQVSGPARPGNLARGRYEGNPFWTSFVTGGRYSMRPEDARGLPGIANSGYFLDPTGFLVSRTAGQDRGSDLVPGGAHRRVSEATRKYLRSSEFCGACHDVRLFGTDVLGAERGEHFKRLRNAYSEWAEWSAGEVRAGREPASCQDCHMSLFPGVCVPGAPEGGVSASPAGSGTSERRSLSDRICPPDTHFAARAPGSYPTGRASIGSAAGPVTTHYFSGVDLPLAGEFSPRALNDHMVDRVGLPLGARQRRDLLLGKTFDFDVDAGAARVVAGRLEIPVVLTNVGAGHRVPAGFSQEREIWVHLRVSDSRGRVVYEVGRVERNDEDLHDKIFLQVNTDPSVVDGAGRPIGLFGADLADGPDVPEWSPPPDLGGARFRGKGLINLQNGFLRCVRCIGIIDAEGRCQPGPGQGRLRSDRFADGAYDIDTGECRSNLRGHDALFEVFFPVGALDATRGEVKGPDAIVDTRSAPPGVPLRYTYDLPLGGLRGPFTVEARLLFRAFPPFLIRAFADYEAAQHAAGLRPSGPLVDHAMLGRLEVIELAAVRRTVE